MHVVKKVGYTNIIFRNVVWRVKDATRVIQQKHLNGEEDQMVQEHFVMHVVYVSYLSF
jgi:hypothetical protein